jgi:pSer/pThr/pTyr-binding forkhead associated (FHA) protein
MSASSFVLELLDGEAGQVLHSWKLGGDDVYQLGRSRDCDVVLSSPVVSRAHACLQHSDDGWELSVLSRHGVFVEGRRVENLPLQDETMFRLAERGPVLRFRSVQTAGKNSGGETICFDNLSMPMLVLDEQLRDREVAEIATGDYFQSLQQKVALLRERATGDKTQISSETLKTE